MPNEEMVESLSRSPVKVLDLETTGLTLSSEPVRLNGTELRAGDDPTLRVRVITVAWADGDRLRRAAFDLDLVSQRAGEFWVGRIAAACMTHTVCGHNVGFDLGWLSLLTENVPERTLDTMLLARCLRPDVPLRLAQIVGEREPERRHFYYENARAVFLKGGGMWTLETLVAVILDRPMEKGYQRPKNWTRAVLTEEHYKYATADVDLTVELLMELLGARSVDEIVSCYESFKQSTPAIAVVEPQVLDVLSIRARGIPVNTQSARDYAKRRFEDARVHAGEMALIEPSLAPFREDLANHEKGVSRELRSALAQAFISRGLELGQTDKTAEYKVGEKDLRLVGAERNPEAKALFDAWVKVAKAQKAGNMALELAAFAARSPDGRVHPLLSHGPATGRLSSAEPNSQQFPGDPDFRAIVEAGEGLKIAASDYSALDVRVGSALCIRAQREILSAYHEASLPPQVQIAIHEAMSRPYEEVVLRMERVIEDANRKLKEAIETRNWTEKDEQHQRLLVARLATRFAFVMTQARLKGEPEWSALREAFRLDLDIHTFTALKMTGQDPVAIFAGLSREQIAKVQKELKEELGEKRKSGKVANLGLLYAMQTAGFRDFANKTFNMGWGFEYSDEIRVSWLDAYPEVDIWHIWTELNPGGRVWVPEANSHGNRPKNWYTVTTLGGRDMVAIGTNAALAYPDQGTGADIIGLALALLREEHPDAFRACINQVHDELVFEFPAAHQDRYTRVISETMSRAGNHYTMPFGVPIEAGCIAGDVWLKD
ncbi:DNA polymerase [Thioalkalivibrio thiocyanodenitrificans]|uniref:DNA polymerase n=1 Tax=Thioalkalivibrio thiocyanodenitrificans TaxID=243063 RepID=UPI000361F0E4|nr:DNA polymerase [Thioalkalivibrio thiocyanodenitrificans]